MTDKEPIDEFAKFLAEDPDWPGGVEVIHKDGTVEVLKEEDPDYDASKDPPRWRGKFFC